MIRHIVMWKFLPEAGGKTKDENLEDVKGRLMALYESGKIEAVSNAEFESLLGRPIPDGHWRGELQKNDAICQLYYAKSGIARFAYKVLTGLKNKAEAK